MPESWDGARLRLSSPAVHCRSGGPRRSTYSPLTEFWASLMHLEREGNNSLNLCFRTAKDEGAAASIMPMAIPSSFYILTFLKLIGVIREITLPVRSTG